MFKIIFTDHPVLLKLPLDTSKYLRLPFLTVCRNTFIRLTRSQLLVPVDVSFIF